PPNANPHNAQQQSVQNISGGISGGTSGVASEPSDGHQSSLAAARPITEQSRIRQQPTALSHDENPPLAGSSRGPRANGLQIHQATSSASMQLQNATQGNTVHGPRLEGLPAISSSTSPAWRLPRPSKLRHAVPGHCDPGHGHGPSYVRAALQPHKEHLICRLQ
ncbi:MAG: hypothetical protein CYPHOPRED_005430, partial [Cyphobasidiales sp. Tagirdzhanova-0007]